MIGSDGLPHDVFPHPRLWGTFPRVLGRYARDEGLIGLEDAVHRMTGKPAAVFGLPGRGELREGGVCRSRGLRPGGDHRYRDLRGPRAACGGGPCGLRERPRGVGGWARRFRPRGPRPDASFAGRAARIGPADGPAPPPPRAGRRTPAPGGSAGRAAVPSVRARSEPGRGCLTGPPDHPVGRPAGPLLRSCAGQAPVRIAGSVAPSALARAVKSCSTAPPTGGLFVPASFSTSLPSSGRYLSRVRPSSSAEPADSR